MFGEDEGIKVNASSLIEIPSFASIFEHQFFHYFKFIPSTFCAIMLCNPMKQKWQPATSHFFVNEISVFQHKFHQQFFRQKLVVHRSQRHHELFCFKKKKKKMY